MKPFRSLLSALCCTALFCGCVQSENSSKQSASSSQPVALEINEREGYNQFAWTLFQNTFKEKENSLISPLSAFFALSLVANGADGQTLAQMEEVLGMPLASLNGFCASLLKDLASNPQAQLQLANAIWLDPDRIGSLQEMFNTIATQAYEAQVFDKPFDASTVKDINAWVSKHTNGLIEEMMQNLSGDTVMVLINALAFEAQWLKVYEESAIQPQSFHNADGSVSQVQMMYSEESSYFEVEGLQGFLKPYERDRYGLALFIAQDENQSLDEALQKADGKKVLEALASPQVRSVDAGLPQFSFDDSKKLNDALQEAGLLDAFSSEQADFSKLATNSQNLAISEVLQKTKIIVDAKGTKAAAATEIMVDETAFIGEEESIRIVCDRPFFYVLLDLQTKTPLLMGVVENLA